MLETQTDGYFMKEKLITQVHKAVTLFERKYPAAQGLFVFFDHAHSHMKHPKDALDVDRMDVKNGGKQPFMRHSLEWLCTKNGDN